MSIKPNPIPTSNPSGALIGYENLLAASTTSDAEKALINNTWERWRPALGSVTVKFQMTAAAEVDYIAIGAHALSGETLVIQTAATVGGAVTDVDVVAPTDNKAIMLTFDVRTIQEVIVTGTLIAASEVGSIFAGKLLRMPRSIYGGHSPISLSKKTKYQSVMSESGQFLGRTITRKGLQASFSWQFLEPNWYRDTFQTFTDSARTKPFYIKWKPDDFSEEVAFGYLTGDPAPSNMGGGHALMSVSVTMRAHSDL